MRGAPRLVPAHLLTLGRGSDKKPRGGGADNFEQPTVDGDMVVHFTFSARSGIVMSCELADQSSVQLELPPGAEMLEKFEIPGARMQGESVRTSFRASLLEPVLRAAKHPLAQMVALNVNGHGLMSVQYLLNFDGQHVFVEYVICPLVAGDHSQ